MAWHFTRMTTALLRLSALLLAVNKSILALTRLVAGLLTSVGTTFERHAANKSAKDI